MTAQYVFDLNDAGCEPSQDQPNSRQRILVVADDRSNQQAMPLALIFSSRLLLTEKSSVSDIGFALAARTETLNIRATLVTPVLQEIRGYSHFGINE